MKPDPDSEVNSSDRKLNGTPDSSVTFSKVDENSEKSFYTSITKASSDLPPFLNNLFTIGAKEHLDFTVTINDKPSWLDMKKFENGQKFHRDHLVGIAFPSFLANIMVLSLQPILLTTILTGTFNTPLKAFKASVSSFLRINSWGEENLWSNEFNTARKNLKVVQSYHKKFHLGVQHSTREEIIEKTSLKKETNQSFKFLANDISKDFKSYCPALSKISNLELGIHQLNMSLVQFAFVGFTVTYPKYFGIHYATDEDLESYIHMWRGFGYLLGIKDEYNFCNCDLEGVRKRTKDLVNLVLEPSLTNLTNKSEYIIRCIIDASKSVYVAVGFEVYLLYLLQLLKRNPASLMKRISWYDFLCFYMLRFLFGFIMKIPYVSKISSKILKRAMESSKNIESKFLRKMEAEIFPYVADGNNHKTY